MTAASYRSHGIQSSLLPWCIILVFLIIEVFTLGSLIGEFLLGDFLPIVFVQGLEYMLLVYVLTVALWMAYQLFNNSREKHSKHAGFGMILPSSPSLLKTPTSPNLLDSSGRADSSWIDEHHFGKLAEDAPSHSRAAYATPNRSNSLHLDTSSSRNGSFTYFNVLDIGASEERKGYQVSEQLKPADSKENIVVKMGPGNRMMLSPASSEGDGQDEMVRLRHALQHARHSPRKAGSILRRSDSMERRRRSISIPSPERPMLSSGSATLPANAEIDAKSSCLREVDLVRGEQRLRAWLVNTILEPLSTRIRETNAKLDKVEHASPPIRIGVSSVEALQAAMISRPELIDTMLPYILPFLHAHSNQAYLVGRISELAADKFMMDYRWNSGGSEPQLDKGTSIGRQARKPWGEHLPTDAMLVFSLFSSYMDGQLTSNPLVGSCRLAQPFTALYTLIAPQRPNAVHLAAESFYLHMSSTSPPHFDFVFNDADGSPSRAAIPRGAKNLFSAILSFINHAKVNNGGKLDRMSIGATGLNIACILE
ncbi:unnamed protein product [Nippostrongylus brasiliensis]|uniref:Transmembrane protein 209 (inferred by orthology to a human protein) n=1 Tax=Nippostrongylus brasiliensis TaxID=27835 RepID=A0A0N4XD34_NIPBR|nr:unnamed protein product [Nippostrongylus brasiliensis]